MDEKVYPEKLFTCLNIAFQMKNKTELELNRVICEKKIPDGTQSCFARQAEKLPNTYALVQF